MTTTQPLSERLSNTDATSAEIDEIRDLERQRNSLLAACRAAKADLDRRIDHARDHGGDVKPATYSLLREITAAIDAAEGKN